jgi:hypothetical protein
MTLMAGGLVDVADFADTDWITVTLASGITHVTNYTLQYRRKSGIVYVQGRVTGLAAATQTEVTDPSTGRLPAGFRPGLPTLELGILANGASTKARVFVQSSGAIGGRTDSGSDLYVFGSYIAGA